jgi:hypothetical protein
MGVALSVTATVGVATIGGLISLLPFGPLATIGILIVGTITAIGETGILISYMTKTDGQLFSHLANVLQPDYYHTDLKSRRDAARSTLSGLQEQLEQLKKLKATLEEQKTDIDDIRDRLENFSHIWATVSLFASHKNILNLTSQIRSTTMLI